jgi:hypothetical protein
MWVIIHAAGIQIGILLRMVCSLAFAPPSILELKVASFESTKARFWRVAPRPFPIFLAPGPFFHTFAFEISFQRKWGRHRTTWSKKTRFVKVLQYSLRLTEFVFRKILMNSGINSAVAQKVTKIHSTFLHDDVALSAEKFSPVGRKSCG